MPRRERKYGICREAMTRGFSHTMRDPSPEYIERWKAERNAAEQARLRSYVTEDYASVAFMAWLHDPNDLRRPIELAGAKG